MVFFNMPRSVEDYLRVLLMPVSKKQSQIKQPGGILFLGSGEKDDVQ